MHIVPLPLFHFQCPSSIFGKLFPSFRHRSNDCRCSFLTTFLIQSVYRAMHFSASLGFINLPFLRTERFCTIRAHPLRCDKPVFSASGMVHSSMLHCITQASIGTPSIGVHYCSFSSAKGISSQGSAALQRPLSPVVPHFCTNFHRCGISPAIYCTLLELSGNVLRAFEMISAPACGTA